MAAQFLTTAQVAERWQCDRSTVTALARGGKLTGLRLGTDWRFSLAAVEAYETRQTTGAPETAPAPKEVQRPTAVAGIALPADYEPVFPELWGMAPDAKAPVRAN